MNEEKKRAEKIKSGVPKESGIFVDCQGQKPATRTPTRTLETRRRVVAAAAAMHPCRHVGRRRNGQRRHAWRTVEAGGNTEWKKLEEEGFGAFLPPKRSATSEEEEAGGEEEGACFGCFLPSITQRRS